jgi:serine/threonine-protein kinase
MREISSVMKNSRLAFALVIALWLAFAGYVWLSASQLPERVATHFGAGGEPNGWMTRAQHVQFTLLFGLLVPAFFLGIFAAIRPLGDRWLNIPRKDYWLAPERREETYDFIMRLGFWLAGMFIAFLAGIHWSILTANARTPIVLPASSVGWVAGPFLVAIFGWMVIFFGRFLRKTE